MAVHANSLVAKLLSLAVGETIYVNDERPGNKASIMERSVQNVIVKSPALKGKRFVTERWTAVQANPPSALAILAVTRLPDENTQ